jgi:hypothetical protein
MTIRSEFKNLFKPRLRRLAFKALVLRVPLFLAFMIALPWIAINAIAVLSTWLSEITEPYMVPIKTTDRIREARQKCYRDAYEINSATEKAAS